LPKKQRLGPKLKGAGLGEHPKKWDPLHISSTVEASNFKFGTQLGFGTSLPKNYVLDQNWQGSGLREHPKKFGTPYLFLQSLKLATSNLVHNLGLGLAYQKNELDHNWWGSGPREHPTKFGTPYVFLQPLKLATWVWDKLTNKTNVLDQNWRGSGPGEHPKKIWDPLRISATVEANNFKCDTQIGFGTSLGKNNI